MNRSARAGFRAPLLSACVALLAVPSLAGAGQLEQVNRVDGVAGIAPLTPTSIQSSVLSDDGRFAYFEFLGTDKEWGPLSGIYRRDLLTNRTVRLVAGGLLSITGITSDDSAISFLSRKDGLTPDDTNGIPDLYRYSVATGRIDLISRADGATGAPTGITGGALLTRGGRIALFQSATGVYRRDLATGTTTRLGDGRLGGPRGATFADAEASADGSVYVSGRDIVTPTGRRSVIPADALGDVEIDESGKVALVRTFPSTTPTTATPQQRTLYRVDTGAATTVTLPQVGDAFTDPAFDATGQTVRYVAGGGSSGQLRSLDLATGTSRSLGFSGLLNPQPTRTGRFALGRLGTPSAVLVAAAPDGASLPGGADPLSTAAWLSFNLGCATNILGYSRSSIVGVSLRPTPGVPAVSSITLAAYTTGGAKIGERTFTASGQTYVAAGTAAWRLVSTIRLAAGGAITESRMMPAIGATNFCPSPSF